MKKIALFALLLVCLQTVFSQDRSFVDEEVPVSDTDTIHWKQDYRLHSADFKGDPDPTSSHVAESATGINYFLKFRDDGSADFRTECIFYRQDSWMRKNMIDNMSYILKHEQGHFDIAEIYTLKLQVALHKYMQDTVNRKSDVQYLYDSLVREQHQMQVLYDQETEHATNSGKQAEWNRLIRLVLSTQLAYASNL